MATVAELEAQVAALTELVQQLQDTSPKHQHFDPKTNVPWLCSSPYCEPPYTAEKGKGPQTTAARNETRGERIT